MTGLMGMLRSGCDNCISSLNYDDFYMPSDDIEWSISLYIYVLNCGLHRGKFTDRHVTFLINKFNEFFSNSSHLINIHYRSEENQNTFLHDICASTFWGDEVCEKMFKYFLSKGVDPFSKNSDCLLCVDLIKNEKIKKKFTKIVNSVCQN